jgi:hypothetical protein
MNDNEFFSDCWTDDNKVFVKVRHIDPADTRKRIGVVIAIDLAYFQELNEMEPYTVWYLGE